MIRTENLCKTYVSKGGVVKVLSNLSITVEKGKCLLLQGSSGSGKSTLLNLMGCLTHPTSGSVFVDGRDVSHLPDHFLTEIRQKKIGFVFQMFNLLQGHTVLDNVAMPLLPLGMGPGPRKQKALSLLHRVNLEHRAHFRVNELSGGEQQRVAVARALVNDPAILIADEPNSNIDQQNSQLILQMLCKLKEDGMTLVISSHDSTLRYNGLVDDILMMGEAR